MKRTLIRLAIAYLVFVGILYFVNAPVGAHAQTSCETTNPVQNRTVEADELNHAGDVMFSVRQTVVYRLDCNFEFVGWRGHPKAAPTFTRSWTVDGCLICLWDFDRWIAPTRHHGWGPWEVYRRNQSAEFVLALVPPIPDKHLILGVWQRVTAVSPMYGTEYADGITGG